MGRELLSGFCIALLCVCGAASAQPGEKAHAADALTAQQVLEKSVAAYEAMETYSSKGVTTMRLEMEQMPLTTTTEFTMKMQQPDRYLVSWSQTNNLLPGMPALKGAIWSDGTQPHLYVSMMNAWTTISEDATAFGAATGISGGAAFTVPSLYLGLFGPRAFPFEGLKDPAVEGTERIGEEECYVISAPSAASKKETFWISTTRWLVLKYERSLEPPEDAPGIGEITDADVKAAIEAAGQDVTEESMRRMRSTLDQAKELGPNLKGTLTEVHTEVGSPELTDADFRYDVPEGAQFKEKLFEGMLPTPAEPPPMEGDEPATPEEAE